MAAHSHTLIAPGPQELELLTGVKTVGVIPMFKHHLPNEEGPSAHIISSAEVGKKVQIVCGPYASNLDEFAMLQQSTAVSWIRHKSDFDSPDLLILPGSKNSASDLAWMREHGIDVEIQNMAHLGVPILGICGGMRILGHEIIDDAGIESPTSVPGLGLLNLTTQFASKKEVRKQSVRFPELPAPWEWLSDSEIAGYEIHFDESNEGTLTPIIDLLSEEVIKHIDSTWLEEFIPILKGRNSNNLISKEI